MSFNPIRKNKLLAKNSEFTVLVSTHEQRFLGNESVGLYLISKIRYRGSAMFRLY